MYSFITLNRGSDLTFTVFWPNGPGSEVGMNLTGWAVDVYEAAPALSGHLTLAITDAANGLISGSINWQDDMPTGTEMYFILRIQSGETSLTLPRLMVRVI